VETRARQRKTGVFPESVPESPQLESKPKMKEKRSHSVVDWRQQGLFALTLVVYSFTTLFIFLWVTFIEDPAIFENVQDGLFLPPAMRELMSLATANWWTIPLVLVFAVFGALLFSHQIFGPMRRFETTLLTKWKNPEVPAYCSLRKSDYFQSFSTLLQDVLNRSKFPQTSKETLQQEAKPGSQTEDPQSDSA